MSSKASPESGSGSGQSPPTITSVTAAPNYTVPDWFFSDNVKTVLQLSATEPKIFLSDLPKKYTAKEGLKHEYAKDEECAFSVCRQTFLSARDTLASCLVRDSHSQLATQNNGVIINFKERVPPEMPGEYVDALAKELGATLVTLTLHDLQALAAAYQDQTPAELLRDFDFDPTQATSRDPFANQTHPCYKLIYHYFGSRGSKKATDAATERSKQAFATILGIRNRSNDQLPVGNKDLAPSHEQPMMIHVAEAQLLTETSHSLRVIARLRDAVFQERKAGKPIILVITFKEDYACTSLLSPKSGIPASAALSISYFVVPAALEKAQDPNLKISTTCIDNLKLLLRFYARQHFDTDTLLPRAKWNLELDGRINPIRDGDSALLERIAMQITGRAFNAQKLGVEDITQVLIQIAISKKIENGNSSFMARHEDVDKGDDSETRSEESDSVASSEDGEDSETKSDQPRERVDPGDLDKYEAALHGSIVQVEQLQDTKYEDVILNDDIKDMMKQLILLSRMKIDVQSSLLMSAVRISGALLYGPPGTGKTHLTRAIANSLGSNMLALDSASLTSKYVGETEKYIKAAFSLARKYEPCILFLDEVDALFYRRSSSDRSWQRSALTQFLQEVDGLQGGLPGAPFVLVATNRPMDLDTAFLRRLPQKMHFELPNEDARAQILRVLINEKDLHADVDIDHLASLTKGYSGSDLKNLCAEAALLWVLEMSQKEAKEAAQRAEASKSTDSDVCESSAAGTTAADANGTPTFTAESDDADPVRNPEEPANATNGRAAEPVAPMEGADVDLKKGNEKTKKEIKRESKKQEKRVRKEARARRRKEREEKEAAELEAEALYRAKFTKVCLTNALFEKALQRMRPTVSAEAIGEIEKFTKLYSDI